MEIAEELADLPLVITDLITDLFFFPVSFWEKVELTS